MRKYIGIAIVIFVAGFILKDLFTESRSEKEENKQEKVRSELAKKYECTGVDDCIAKYNFEAARAYMGTDDLGVYKHIRKITKAESVYLAKNEEFEEALDVVKEAYHINYTNGQKSADKFVIIEMAVDHYLDNGSSKDAKKWALKASENLDRSGGVKRDRADFIDQKSYLLKKIREYKEIMKS